MSTVVPFDSVATNNHPDPRALIAAVEANSGNESAVVFAADLVAIGIAYLIEQRGTVAALDEIINSL
jgi:hypothetical protein